MDFQSAQRLDGRVALVTGGGGGIGRAIAEGLAQLGAIVAVTDLDVGMAEKTAEGICKAGGLADAHVLDVAEEESVRTAIGTVVARHGRLDILVNNAGIGARMPAEDMPLATWRRVIDVDLTGTFLCCREAARFMLAERRGAIVNVASIMGLVGGGLYPNPAYQAAKGGVVNLTRALALDWADRGVRVNAVAPAFARTQLTEALFSDAGIEQAVIANTPLRRLVEPAEVAAAVLFLVSDAAAMITGHTLPVDGGWLAR